MQRVSIDTAVRQRFAELRGLLNERERRVWAAVEAKALGYGGISAVARATGISRRAIHVGLRELSTVRSNYAASWRGGGSPNFASSLVFVYVHSIGLGW